MSEHPPGRATTGILIARAWPQAGELAGIHIRLMWAVDVIGDARQAVPRTVVVDSRDALLAVVSDWFAQITGATRQPGPGSGEGQDVERNGETKGSRCC